MHNTLQTMERPSFFWLLTEPGRALTELGLSYSINRFQKVSPTGDGHPVMILPGLMSSGFSTKLLRKHIRKLGYDVFDWGLGRNMGKVEYMELLIEHLDERFQQKGEQLSLIGWSLGGVFARQIAKERPDLIRQVITLGSPFMDITHPNNIEWVFSVVSGGRKAKHTNQILLENLPLPAPVPTTAIYSKMDGVVPWKMCMETEDEIHQNIEVRSSHIGFGVNTAVYAIIADRLQYKKSDWQWFKPKGFVENLLFYPSL